MDKNRVLAALDVLSAELADADQVSDDARQKLEQVAGDIRRRLEGAGSAAAKASGESMTRLQQALLEFEAEHPQLTGAIGQVASALANLGI